MYRGFTKSYRREQLSDIWRMPPLYHRVWYWLRQNVNHSKNMVPTPKGFAIWVLAGQRLTSYQNISEGVQYVENRQTIMPDRKTIQKILRWLEWHKMIVLTCHTSGTLVTIVNWHTYNNLGTEVATDVGTVSTLGITPGNGAGDGLGRESGVGRKQELIRMSTMKEKNNSDEDFSEEEFDEYEDPPF